MIGKPDTKVQLSFKVRFIKNWELYFGYTQLLLWDLFKSSAPLRDVNYNPELFYRLHFEQGSESWVDFGGFEHESNGRAGASSRSWNRVYALVRTTTLLGQRIKGAASLKVWIPYGADSTSRDLSRYRGIFELQLGLIDLLGPFFGANDLTLRIYPGGRTRLNPLQGGQELTLRTKTSFKALSPAFVAQLFRGYGENLLDAQSNRFGARVGIGF